MDRFEKAIAEARASTRKLAKAAPHFFPQYVHWKACVELTKQAKQKEADAKKAWDAISK